MMAQWHACKEKAKDALLLFRLGDFYEAFYEDAVQLSKVLGIALTKRGEVPMAGIPHHACESYLDRLIAQGLRVAIAEQLENAKPGKTIVAREIVRQVTPGTLVQSGLLQDKANNYLACIVPCGKQFGVACLDISTADFRACEVDSLDTLGDLLYRMRPKEILLSETWPYTAFLEEMVKEIACCIHKKQEHAFDKERGTQFFRAHFHENTFALPSGAMVAAGVLLLHVKNDIKLSIDHVRKISSAQRAHAMEIDRIAEKHLELFEPLRGPNGPTLFGTIDHTHTPMGARMLRYWLQYPLLDIEKIVQRQDVVERLAMQDALREELREELRQMRDIERMLMRTESGYISPRELLSLRLSLEHIAPVRALLAKESQTLLAKMHAELFSLDNLIEILRAALVDHPPLRLGEDRVFKTGYSHELDELRSFSEETHAWLARYQSELKEETEIKSLKVGYTKAFGFYIEVSRGQAQKIPASFERKQTLVNAERFTTPTLKEYEYRQLHAEGRIEALENQLFVQLRMEVAKYAEEIRKTAKTIAFIDCICALAHLARSHDYIRPVVNAEETFFIEKGRHPVLDVELRERFIPNDVSLDGDRRRLLLITGPNMGGKSTYIRQTALLAILAQMGSFIPAKSARMGIVDRIFSRIGASDDLARGQSTFMVEMAETAHILRNATEKSLIILDEIGRGTSTYDGIAIAWAIVEHLLTKERSKVLFATHYSELTQLEEKLSGLANIHVAVQEQEGKIAFLHKIRPGTCDKSYGIYVAKLAGLPSSVIERAWKVLHTLENNTSST